jgi:hypothetical protein
MVHDSGPGLAVQLWERMDFCGKDMVDFSGKSVQSGTAEGKDMLA